MYLSLLLENNKTPMNLAPFPNQFQTLSSSLNNQLTMSRSLFRTLIRPTTSICCRRISTEPCFVEVSITESNLVEKIEDAIHRTIVKRSEPDWLPFRPGSSYWVPPRRPSYGVAEVINKLSNPLNEDQAMAVTTLHGWPSSDFFVPDDDSNVQVSSSSDEVQELSSDITEGNEVQESSSGTAECNTSTATLKDES